MHSILIHLKKIDWILVITSFLLVSFGLLSIYSSSLAKGNFFNLKKQIIFLIISLFLMFFLSFIDWRILKENSYLILFLYFFCILILIGLFFFAPEIRRVKSWYKIGPISIDPTEFTKIVLVILFAKYFSKRHVEMYQVKHILVSSFYLLIPSVLVFLQPNLGSVLILIFLWIGILIISGIKIRHFLVLCILGFLILALTWSFFLKDYQKQRMTSFFQPKIEPVGIGWSQNQSKIAIGSGGLFGQGFFKGSQTHYGFLPEPQTDFIFASIAEETGMAGAIILLLLFSLLVWRIVKIAFLAESNFPKIFSCGLVIILISEVFINIGMNLGLLPIIGVSLPLVSYGGSGLISIFIAFGILQSIQTH
jgi:rod shape determining protein RodA